MSINYNFLKWIKKQIKANKYNILVQSNISSLK